MKKILIVFVLIAFSFSFALEFNKPQAQPADYTEKIYDYYSDIVINKNGSIEVTENIEVNAQNISINHGIYRDFPTDYRMNGWLGKFFKLKAGFKVLEVKRDGLPEPYSVSIIKNGMRVYIGDKDKIITPGRYKYSIKYRTTRQLGYFETYDELYYNITGSGWEFPISKIRAKIHLPDDVKAKDVRIDGYVGYSGEKGKDYTSSIISSPNGSNAYIETKYPLYEGEGLTVAVSWPKGYVKEPTILDNMIGVIQSNIIVISTALVTFFLGIVYFFIWMIVGRDPNKGTIIPRFEAPKGFSPAQIRYINKMGFDMKAMVSALVSTATKGIISIQEKKGVFSITQLSSKLDALSPDELILIEKFFGKNAQIVSHEIDRDREVSDDVETGKKFTFSNKRYSKIQSAIKLFRESLEKDLSKTYVKQNSIWLVPGVTVSLLLIVFISFMSRGTGGAGELIFLTLFLLASSLGVATVLINLSAHSIRLMTDPIDVPKIIGLIIFLIVFWPLLFGEVFIVGLLMSEIGIIITIMLLTQIILHLVYFQILKARTKKGRLIQDEIEGFKMFLKATDTERIKMFHKVVPKSITEYERKLPFAIALNLEGAWTKQFKSEIDKINNYSGDSSYNHYGSWYTGSTLAGSFSSSFASSFSASISSSSNAPGSSSGSGGGGSSGGGGGGGGGGGW